MTPIDRAWQTAWTHLCTRTLAQMSPAAYMALCRLPRVRQALERVEAAMLAGESVMRVQAALQHWSRMLGQTVRAQRKEVA